MITQDITQVLEEVRRTEELEMLRQRVWERAGASWWDRHGEGVLWAVAGLLTAATLWAVLS